MISIPCASWTLQAMVSEGDSGPQGLLSKSTYVGVFQLSPNRGFWGDLIPSSDPPPPTLVHGVADGFALWLVITAKCDPKPYLWWAGMSQRCRAAHLPG